MLKIDYKEILLLYVAIQGFISYVPQITKIIKTRSSKDISISTWLMWLASSTIYLLYLLLEGVGIWLILSQLLEITLIAVTVFVVILYKNR